MPVDLSTYQGVDLLSPDERNEFRAAMMDIKATFYKTPVLYKLAGTTFSRWGEQRKLQTGYADHNLMGFVEYSQLVEDKYLWTSEGAVKEARVRVTFNSDYLDQQGLWDGTNNVSKFNGTDDIMIIAGTTYRITEIPVYDGMIDAKSVLTILYAEPIVPKTT